MAVHAQGYRGTLCKPNLEPLAAARLLITDQKPEVTCKTCLRVMEREARWLALWGPKVEKPT